jgi:Alcohol dehydrogenase GroES-like domain
MAHHQISRARNEWPHDIPKTMKAAAVDRFGPPSALTLHEVPVPRPGPQEVLIAIDTAGIGSWDASIRDGSWRMPGRARFPLVPGVDGAGVVVPEAHESGASSSATASTHTSSAIARVASTRSLPRQTQRT